ncbi:MAG TPA: DedA family protein [Candidatus Babeliales bacterium]|nr:DedA family protein [Candidatus Babeliales bacterium]
MDILHYVLTFILHLDDHLIQLVTTYGIWTYIFLFGIIFLETAIIPAAILPGDSLLFASGALAASAAGVLNIHLLFILLVAASVMGNGLNYYIGKWLGPKIFRSHHSWLFNKKHIDNAHRYYERYGGKTIIIARFIPIVRTVAPFIAGIGYMTYRQFFVYNLTGALLWIGFLLYGSFLFGNIPIVKQNFSLVIVAIVVISILPAILEFIYQKYSQAKA